MNVIKAVLVESTDGSLPRLMSAPAKSSTARSRPTPGAGQGMMPLQVKSGIRLPAPEIAARPLNPPPLSPLSPLFPLFPPRPPASC